MKKSNRLYAWILALALILGLFAGCAADPQLPDKGGEVEVTEPMFTLEALPEEQKLQNAISRAPGGSTKEYTVMLYLVGSDLESNPDGGCASIDIDEILSSGLDTQRVNFLIYTGGSRYWHNGIPSDCNVIYLVTGSEAEIVAYTEVPANMGDPATFLDFLSYSYTNFPAKHYGLICWDHGAGPLGGYGFDELFPNDRLYLQEMAAAFAASPVAKQKLDFLGFDACLMATMEVAEMADNYAKFLIASEETEPGCGWDYSFLKTMNSTSDTKTIANSILRTYEDYMGLYRLTPKYTLSVMDLSKMGSFRSAADKLFAKLEQGVSSGSYSAIAQARNKTLRFGQTAKTPYDLVDMGHMATNLKSICSSEASAFQAALKQLVVGQVSNIQNTSGLAIYFPYDSKETYTALGADFHKDLSECAGYESFVAAFTDYWINGEPAASFTEHEVVQPEVVTPTVPAETTPPPADVPTAPAAPQFNGASVQLNAQQLANLSEVTYTIFRADIDRSSGQTVYIPVLSRIPLTPDSTGTVKLPADQKLILLKTDEDATGILWPSEQLSATYGTMYMSIDGYLTTGTDTAGSQQVAMTFSEGNSSRMNILTLTNMGNSEAAGRSEPELSQWEYIANRYVTLFPTCNNAGNLTAYTSWDDSGDEYYQLLSYSEEFWLEQVPMTQLQEQFFAQIVITDTQGNTYASKLTEYYNGNTYCEYIQDGVVYHIYSDHAEVVDYTDAGGELFIAEAVAGQKVTKIAAEAFYYNRDLTYVYCPASLEIIGERAFANCRNLTGVYLPASVKQICSEAFAKSGLAGIFLPEGLERIEAQAFAGTKISSLRMPASVSYLGAGVFADCTDLIGITIDGNTNGSNRNWKTVNGSLLTADGKELVQAPLGGSTVLNIPEGVTTIRSGAVRGSDTLKEVNFPETLQHIGSYAFYDTVNLQSLTLPAGLETIGHSAFGQFGVTVNENSPIRSVDIGAKVRWIGYDAFDAFPISQFRVDAANQAYSAASGHLLNKAGTIFVHAAYTHAGTLNIPEGVSHLAFHSLSMCDNITALVLSDSVVSMDENVGLPEKMTSLTVGRGLARWDNVADTHYLEQVTIHQQNPYFVLYDSCIYSRDLTTLYACLNKSPKITLADTLVTIQQTAFSPAAGYNDTMTELNLPASVAYLFGDMFKGCRALEAVNIHEDNPSYLSSDGLIYTKNGVSLILCPQGKTGNVAVRIGTSTIWKYALYGNLKCAKVVIPAGVTTIRKGNLVSYRSEPLPVQLPESLEKIYPDMFRSPDGYEVTCPAGSVADTFARSRGVEVTHS